MVLGPADRRGRESRGLTLAVRVRSRSQVCRAGALPVEPSSGFGSCSPSDLPPGERAPSRFTTTPPTGFPQPAVKGESTNAQLPVARDRYANTRGVVKRLFLQRAGQMFPLSHPRKSKPSRKCLSRKHRTRLAARRHRPCSTSERKADGLVKWLYIEQARSMS